MDGRRRKATLFPSPTALTPMKPFPIRMAVASARVKEGPNREGPMGHQTQYTRNSLPSCLKDEKDWTER